MRQTTSSPSALRGWAHKVTLAGDSQSSRTRRLRKVNKRVLASKPCDVDMLRRLLTANVDYNVAPPKPVPGRKWSMVDSGSQPTVADCEKEVPGHTIRPSAGQKQGVQYKCADGSLIPNMGECCVTHREHDGTLIDFVFQHAKVHTPIVSVLELVIQDCTVTFHKAGGTSPILIQDRSSLS